MAKKYNDLKQYFVSFYKGGSHYVFYSRLVFDKSEVINDIKSECGKVSNLVIDQVI